MLFVVRRPSSKGLLKDVGCDGYVWIGVVVVVVEAVDYVVGSDVNVER